MDINLNIDPQQINQMVVDAILKSAIGEQIDKAIKSEIAKLSGTYDNPIQKVIAFEVESIVRSTVQEQYKDRIRMWVAEKLTEQFTEELFTKLWDAFISRFTRGY